jgi:hypothetical protein
MSLLGRLTIGYVWIALVLGAAFIGPASNPIGLPDISWTLLRGSWIASHGTLLEADPFTSAPHIPGEILNLQWLADLIYHGLDALGGIPMVITGTALVVMVTYAVLLAATATASGHLRLSCLAVAVAYAVGGTNLSPRPQTLAYPLFAVFLLAVVRAEWRKDTRLLWVLPLLTIPWANLHGSFFTGFLLVGCAGLGRLISTRSLYAIRPYALTVAACVLATVVTPYGPRSLVYLATISSNQIIHDYVTEWAPTSLDLREGPIFFASLILVCGLMLRSRLRLTASEIVTLLVFGYLAWSSVRAVVWWGFVIAPPLARLLGSVLPHGMPAGRNLPVLNGLMIAGIAMLAWLSLPWNKTLLPVLPAEKQGLFSPDTPVQIGNYLREHDPPPGGGKMLNAQEWGGYLEWATWPRHQVFLDGRIELHPDQVWLDYLDIVYPSARWRALVDRYDISYFVLDKEMEQDLIADLRADNGWRLDYEDELGVIFERAGSAS